MYAYFIDEEVSARHKRDLDRVDLSLTSRGISGRKVHLNRLSDLAGSIRECVASGIKTLVAVGGDATLSRLINACVKPEGDELRGAVFGVLPVGGGSAIARAIGCAELPGAIDALARRHVVRFDLGTLNDRHYFL